MISTHTPLAGRDCRALQILQCGGYISTHTPLAGRDLAFAFSSLSLDAFQLTRPSRGVTYYNGIIIKNVKFQLTRPSRGVTIWCDHHKHRRGFQLTRPSRGVTEPPPLPSEPSQFQLTRPSRGVTGFNQSEKAPSYISTHTPLAGRDCVRVCRTFIVVHFNSHAPRGA